MDKSVRCLDTYALIEITNGNPLFGGYLDVDFIITDLTLAEFYAVILREYDETTAEYWYRKLEQYSVLVDKMILKEAVKFRYENRKKGISFFDAVGYAFSIKKGYLFVTGDKEFESFKGVEFKKK
ncbi:PIN domain protein [archaeon BMS3Abin17]|nr:PIN domain protein [archaeon BMS3Abin17]HDZ61323.1 type II toxin-antitoxin system VapC family toxin [Candidatus Pacearchaeota archaeon]